MSFQFVEAVRSTAKARVALNAPSGAGKTVTMLRILRGLSGDESFAVIDTERESAQKFVGEDFGGGPVRFKVLNLDHFSIDNYIAAINAAADAGFPALGIDSLSHAWFGKGGALEEKDQIAARTGDSYGAWAKITPKQNKLVDAILGYPGHVVVTMRAKQDYVRSSEGGKTTITKVGLAPVQRDGIEYEFDIVCDIDMDHNLHVEKTRAPRFDELTVPKADEDFGRDILEWLDAGESSRDRFESFFEEGEPTDAEADALMSVVADVPESRDDWRPTHYDTAMELIDRLKRSKGSARAVFEAALASASKGDEEA